MNNFTSADITTAFTRELTDERVATAAAYWLDCSPHERWEPDGIILARYARKAMSELQQTREELERFKKYIDTTNYNSEKLAMELTRKEIELEQVEAERDAYREVLEGYAITKLEGARNVLNQYKGEPNE